MQRICQYNVETMQMSNTVHNDSNDPTTAHNMPKVSGNKPIVSLSCVQNEISDNKEVL